MAEAVVSLALEKLNQLLLSETDLILEVKDEMKSLFDGLKMTQAFFRDCERVPQLREPVQMLLNELRDLAFDAEDIINTYVISTTQDSRRDGLCKIFCFGKLKKKHYFACRIKDILKKMEHVLHSRERLGIGTEKASDQDQAEHRFRRGAHIVENVVGFKAEAKTLVERLIGSGGGGQPAELAIISIVGMGGLGKTTLAGMIYNDLQIKKGFESCAWVYVSKEYRCNEVLLSILKQFRPMTEDMDRMGNEDLGMVLKNYLTGWKYLIVMDDVWTPQVWEDFRTFFPNQGNGSRVIITTRDNEVAVQANSGRRCLPHYLRHLDKEESWELFQKKAFPIPGENCTIPQWEEMGRQMAEKCGGLPLAIVALGGILSMRELNSYEWTRVAEHVYTFLAKYPNLCQNTLALSYDALPYYLKPCFLYFGMFPKDHEIPARQLIQLWIAEGFIQVKEGETLEETAETYLEKLVVRSLIQVASRRSDNGVKTCSIHVLLHDLCISEAKKDRFFQIHGHEMSSPNQSNPWRLAGNFESLVDIICYPYAVASVRSILCFTESSDTSSTSKSYKILDIYKNLPLLRVLRIEGSDGNPLPNDMGNMIYLKYFGISSKTTSIKIPPSICNSWNLETLDIRSIYFPNALDGIWKMKKLRHVYFQGQTRLPQPRSSSSSGYDHDSSLVYLQTVSTICPSSCTRQVFSKLPNLLKLGVCGDLESYIYDLLDNLVLSKNLQSLKLVRTLSSESLTRIPNHLPPMLTKLTLRDTALRQDPMPVLGKLLNLQILKLVGNTYIGIQMVCSAEGFQRLQFLQVVRSKLCALIFEKGAMPNINHLVVRDCDFLCTFDEEDSRLSAQLDVKNVIERWQEITSAIVEEKEIKDASIWPIGPHGFPFIKMDRNRLGSEMANTGVVSFLLEDLSQLLLKEADLVLGVKDEVQSLCDQLKLMHPIIMDCERVYRDDENAKIFLNNIRDLSYDAEDTIYTYVISIAQDRGSSRTIHNIKMRHKVAQKIVDINKRMEEFYFNKDKFGIGIKKASEASEEHPPRVIKEEDIVGFKDEANTLKDEANIVGLKDEANTLVDEANIVGFKDEANTLLERLIGGKSERVVISIVGMGGLGKTTLAKKIYSHQSIRNGFQCRAWVTVSQEYKPTKILQSLIKHFIRIPEDMEMMSEEELGKVLKNCLTGRKYLVVMDDVWIPEVWQDLNSFFPNQGNGSSRIMITTRNNEVAMQANPVPNCPPHYLRYLDEEESWELFRSKAFQGENCSPQLEEVGRQMAEKCGGLPLAVVALGGLLSEKEPNFNKWREVAKHVDTFLAEQSSLCQNRLALSYDALPYYLKPCFLYFGMFPKDHEIPARQLIQLWIAEGFIEVTDGEILEDTAETYLEKLIHQSLIQVATRRTDYGVKTCRIHVLLHDLSISEAQKERFFQIHGPEINSPTPKNHLRLAGNYDSLVHIICNPYAAAKVRSLLIFTGRSDTLGSGAYDKYSFVDIYKKFPFLRVMRIEHSSTAGNALCGEMTGKLIHLRYFRMSSEISLVKIPPSICEAWNLQTLDIRSRCLPNAPDEIWKMKNLRHIHFQGQTRLPQPSNDNDSSLEYLQTLSTICPSSCSSQLFSKVPNLLKLGVCGDLKPHMETLFNNLIILKNLQSLKLIRTTLSSKPPTRILSGLPPSLTKITICDTSLRQDPMPVLGKLPNLQILKLVGDAYYGSWLICSPKGFPQLQLWNIVRSKVRYLIINEGAMKKLNRLVVRDSPSLNLEKAMPQLTAQQVVVEHTLSTY